MTSGTPRVPQNSPPSVPEGWNAEWSNQHRAWFYYNQATQTSTWENPSNRGSVQPPFPPPNSIPSMQPSANRDFFNDDKLEESVRGLFSPLHNLGHVFCHHHSASPPPNTNLEGVASLYIHCACFADQDITQKIRGMVTPQQTLSIYADALTYHFGDPRPNHVKQFALIYSYGSQPWQLIVCSEGDHTINLNPSTPVDRIRADFLQSPQNRVIALVWGIKNALEEMQNSAGRSAGMKLMEIEREGRLEATNAWMGFDGNENEVKTAMCFYRHPDGSVGVATAREWETLRLPWNTFAGAVY